MEGILDFIARQGVDPTIVAGIGEFRAAHPTPDGLTDRIPRPHLRYLGKEVWEEAACALLCGENLLLAGPKATGKNVLAQNLACAFGRPEWDLSLHVDIDATLMLGSDTFADGKVVFRPGPICLSAQEGGFCVLDEINMARGEALAALHAALDHRRIVDVPGYGLVRLDGATRFVATMNVGYAGTRELNEALASRFVVVTMPPLDRDGVERLLRAEFPALKPAAARQLAALYCELRLKCERGEITDRALDLRGLLGAVRLMGRGLPASRSLRCCITNKVFDAYERSLVEDAVAARIPKAWKAGDLFA